MRMHYKFNPNDTRPFNLVHVQAGAPFCMRNGEPVRIIKSDMDNQFSIVGIFRDEGKEWVGTWYPDGSYSKNEEGELPKDLVMKPLAYIEGRPVHYGNELTRNMGAGYISTIEAFPELDFDSGEFAWPETINLKDHAPTAKLDITPKGAFDQAKEILKGIDKVESEDDHGWWETSTGAKRGADALARIIDLIESLLPKQDTVTLTKSDIQHVVWAYVQLSEEIHRFESAEHVNALREIAVKHGGLIEAKGKVPDEFITLKPLHDYQQAAVDAMNQSFVAEVMPGHEVTSTVKGGSLAFIDDILPESFPVKFAVPDSQFEQAAKEALTVPPELLKAPDDDFIPWSGSECPVAPDQVVRVRFRYGAEWQGRADDINWSHTDSRVSEGSQVVGYKLMHKKEIVDPIKQLEWENTELIASNKALNEANMQQAERSRQLIEANTALENRVRAHLEDNAKLGVMHSDQIAETGRWMAEAKKLGEEKQQIIGMCHKVTAENRSLTDKLNGYRNRVDELNSRLSKIAAYVRDDVEAVRGLPLSQYRAAILSKVID